MVKKEKEEVLLRVVKTSWKRGEERISKQRLDRAIFSPAFLLSIVPGNPSGERASSPFTHEFYASLFSLSLVSTSFVFLDDIGRIDGAGLAVIYRYFDDLSSIKDEKLFYIRSFRIDHCQRRDNVSTILSVFFDYIYIYMKKKEE